jgi:hypothetical protein
MRTLFSVTGKHDQFDIATQERHHGAVKLFSPVLAMFSLEQTDGEDAGITLSSGDLAAFFTEHKRSIQEQKDAVAAMCPTGTEGSVITAVAAGIYATFQHIDELVADHAGSVGAIESILRAQLISAIGKEVQPSDFAEYMDFHNRKLFVAEHAPERFCYAIRRQDRFPDGTLAIESTGSAANQPLLTSAVHSKATKPMRFALSAASEVKFMGDRHVHAAISTRFPGSKRRTSNWWLGRGNSLHLCC